MSALDEFLAMYGDDADFVNECKAELAQLRAAAKEAQEAHVYLDESPVNGDPDETPVILADRIALLVGDVIKLRATVAEQARQLAEAHKLLLWLEWTDWNKWSDRVDAWLAANPAPEDSHQ